MKAEVVELSDRYLVLDIETRENLDGDSIGFVYADSAKEWAERQGHEVVKMPE